jgi:hypothetical protein
VYPVLVGSTKDLVGFWIVPSLVVWIGSEVKFLLVSSNYSLNIVSLQFNQEVCLSVAS